MKLCNALLPTGGRCKRKRMRGKMVCRACFLRKFLEA